MTTCAGAACTAAEIDAGIDAKLAGYPQNNDIDSFWLLCNGQFGMSPSHLLTQTCAMVNSADSNLLSQCF